MTALPPAAPGPVPPPASGPTPLPVHGPALPPVEGAGLPPVQGAAPHPLQGPALPPPQGAALPPLQGPALPGAPWPPPGAAPAPFFGRRWTGPSAPPSRVVLGAIAAAGVATAFAIPTDRPGVGWFVTALAIAVAGLAVHRYTRRSAPPLRFLLADAGWTLAAIALAGVSAVRAAEWLAVLCLLAACGAGALAVTGRSFRGVASSVVAVPLAALRGVPWVGRAVLDARRGANRRALRLVASGLVGLLLVLVFGSLLTSADAAFAGVVDDLLPTLDGSSAPRWIILFVLGAWAMTGACFLLVAPPVPVVPVARTSRLRGLEWALPVGLLVALFALFVAVQFATLFGSDDHVLGTSGLTYAEYARSGFWQLLLVTVLALGVIAVGSGWAPMRTPAERALKRGLLAALAVLTLVIVASALSRMWLYQQAYGFTVLRLVVLTCELWLGAGFLLVLVGVLRLRPTGLARGMAAAGVVALLALALLDPEQFVAEHNVTRFAETGRLDARYLEGLSADAVPALLELPEPERSCTLARMALRPPADGDWQSANASRSAAAATLAELRPVCAG